MGRIELLTERFDKVRQRALSPAGQRILILLEKGSAYRVRDAWRLRGSRRRIQEPTIDSLLASGFAERIEADRCSEIRITPAGRVIACELREASYQANHATSRPRNLAAEGWLRSISAIRRDPMAHRGDFCAGAQP